MATPDIYRSPAPGMDGPAVDGFAIPPEAFDLDLPNVTRLIWVGTGGNLALQVKAGDPVLLKNIPNGTMLAIRAHQVLSAGTTAADIVGLY